MAKGNLEQNVTIARQLLLVHVPFKRLLILKNNFELFVIIHLTLPSILMIEVLMAMAMVTVMLFVG